MHWQTKARIFRALSMTPFGDNIHYFLQRKVTKELPRRVCGLDELLATARNLHADTQRHLAEDLGKAQFVEIGAGRIWPWPSLCACLASNRFYCGHFICGSDSWNPWSKQPTSAGP
ncbi:hypothetical protein CS8_075770 [Cupriavidus sp. 8B]